MKPLNDLEIYELLQAAYPGKFTDDDEGFEDAQEFADNLAGWEEVADLLGRVAMLAMPMGSPLTGSLHHVLGQVTIREGQAYMMAAVKRPVKIEVNNAKQS